MTVPFHNIVSLDRIKNEEFNRTWKISGSVTKADEGKAVTQDLTAPNTVKLAGDGDYVFGRMEIYETDGTATVQHRFSDMLPIKDGETIAVGDTVVGGGNGTVKALKSSNVSAPNPSINSVAAVVTGYATVVKL